LHQRISSDFPQAFEKPAVPLIGIADGRRSRVAFEHAKRWLVPCDLRYSAWDEFRSSRFMKSTAIHRRNFVDGRAIRPS
jgi:hypothetical protein